MMFGQRQLGKASSAQVCDRMMLFPLTGKSCLGWSLVTLVLLLPPVQSFVHTLALVALGRVGMWSLLWVQDVAEFIMRLKTVIIHEQKQESAGAWCDVLGWEENLGVWPFS